MYVRKLKKGKKTYFYYYKSKRMGNKVKSIYVGRALKEDIKKPVKNDIGLEARKTDKGITYSLLEFDNLLNEINSLINNKNLSGAIFKYDEIFKVYNDIEINKEDKAMLFEKLNNVYESLIGLSKEIK